jgi:hypothetical protein
MTYAFFKTEAIEYSWELLTKVYQIPKDRLYVTYFEGDPKNGLPPDEEARQHWLKQGVADDHILPGNAKDNFWGETKYSYITFTNLFVIRNGCYWSMRSLQVCALNILAQQ